MKINHTNMQISYSSNQNTCEPISVKEGEIIQAKIVKIEDGIVLLDMGKGEKIEAKLSTLMSFQEGKLYNFLIKEVFEGQITIKPFLDEEALIKFEKEKIHNLLQRLGILPDKEKTEIVKEMLRFQIPIQSSTIRDISNVKIAYERIADLLHHIPMEEKELLETQVQSLLKKMIAIQTEQLPMDNRKEAPMIPTGNEKPAILLQDNKEGIQHPIKEENKNLEVNADKNMEIGMEKHIPKPNEILKNSSIHPEAGIIPEKKLPNLLENINIKNLTYEKIIFLLKNNFQTNLINAVKVNEILYREAPLGKQLQTLIAGLKDHKEMEEVTKTFENIQSKMKVSLIQDKAGLKDVIKELYSHVHRAGEMIESGVIRGGKELLQQVESVKNSIDFMNKINQYQGFIQLPLHINGQERNLEILLCNKNKKNSSKNPKDMKIFISLDTKTMETVQAFIEIKEKGVACNFRLENERIKEYIEKNEKKLHHTLEALGFEKIDIRYNVFSGNLNLLQVLEEESQMKKTKRNFLDLRV